MFDRAMIEIEEVVGSCIPLSEEYPYHSFNDATFPEFKSIFL